MNAPFRTSGGSMGYTAIEGISYALYEHAQDTY